MAASSWRLTPSSPRSWPSSQRTHSAAIQKLSQLRYTHLGGILPQAPVATNPSSLRPLPEPWEFPTLWSSNLQQALGVPLPPILRGHRVTALPRQMSFYPSFLVPPELFSMLGPEASSREIQQSPKQPCRLFVSHQEMLRCIWGHFLRVIRGTSPTLSHSSSLLHSLGSVTVSVGPKEGPGFSRSMPGACLPLKWPLAGWGMPSPSQSPYPYRFCAVWTSRGSCHGQTPAQRPCCSSAGRWSPHTAATRT